MTGYKFFESFVWCVLVLFFSIISKGERLPVKTYTVADGLLRDFVNKIKQDSHGFLWFCTPGGVSRYDGYAFTNFTVADGLPVRQVNDFLETRSGEIWLGTNAGLVKLNPKGVRAPFSSEKNAQSSGTPFFSVYQPKNAKAATVYVLYENKAGQIFAGTSDGLYKLNGQNELEEVSLIAPSGDALEITAILEDRRGNLWIGTQDNSLLRLLPDGRVEQFTMNDGLPGKNIETLLEDKNGRIWVGMRAGLGAGLCLLAEEPARNQKIVERIYTVKDGLPDDWILSLFQTSSGQMWVGTIRGLCKWQGENGGNPVCKTYTAKNDLTDTEIWTLTEDKDGNLWSGTRIGAKKLARYGFTTYTEADGIDPAFLNSIFENAQGELFVSADPATTRTVSRYNGEKFDLIKPNFPLPMYFGSGNRQTVWQDETGDWWFPSGSALFRFPRPAKFEDLAKDTPQKILVGGKASEIFRLFEDSRGDIWISTISNAFELWRWERATDVWHDYTKEVDFDSNRFATDFIEDRTGHLWIGTSDSRGSLIRFGYGDGRFRNFSEADGAPTGATNDLFIDEKDNLWIANSSVGLLKLKDLNAEHLDFALYSTAEGLSTQSPSSVTGDGFGRIYIGTGRGLDRLTPETGQIENFTTADGLPGSYPIISYRDRRNNLWFITANGLARFVPEPPRERKPPNVFITGVRISGIPQAISILGETAIENIELNSDQRQITIDFLGLGVNLGERLKYEYRFNGAEWTRTDERTVNFANLGAGQYEFEVRAQTSDRIYSQPAKISFRISAPIWQRWWFISASVVLVGLMIYGFYRFRVLRLLEVANMRTRIATDLHDDIGANLTKIAILSEVAQQRLEQKASAGEDAADNLFGSVAEISRESVSSMSDIVWAINPKKDSLIGLTRRMRQYAEEILERRDINLEFNAPVVEPDIKLDANIRRNIYLIFKESVNNIVRHSNASAVKIDFKLLDKNLVLEVDDNGIGFDATKEYDGNGLLNIKKRAKDCGGWLEIDSSEGAGTKIVLRLKLKSPVWSWR